MHNMATTSKPQSNVTRAVRVLMADRRVSAERLARVVGIGADSLRSKTSGRRPWTLDETVEIARYFDVPITYLTEPDSWLPSAGPSPDQPSNQDIHLLVGAS